MSSLKISLDILDNDSMINLFSFIYHLLISHYTLNFEGNSSTDMSTLVLVSGFGSKNKQKVKAGHDRHVPPLNSSYWQLSVHVWTSTNFLSLIKVQLLCLLCLYLRHRSVSRTAGCSGYILCLLAPWGISSQWNASIFSCLVAAGKAGRSFDEVCDVLWRFAQSVKHHDTAGGCTIVSTGFYQGFYCAADDEQVSIRCICHCSGKQQVIYLFVLWTYAGNRFYWCLLCFNYSTLNWLDLYRPGSTGFPCISTGWGTGWRGFCSISTAEHLII